METNKMYCPCCKSEIIKGKAERYQTLDEHVSNPNSPSPLRLTNVCSNEFCETRKHDIFWDDMGDMYGGYDLPDSAFINENNSPFGSLGRKLNVEIQKVGLKKTKYLSPKWCFGWYRPYLEWNYKSNYNGDVLKTRITVKFLKKDNNGNYCLGVIPFWKTFAFLWNRFQNNIDRYKTKGSKDSLKRAFTPSYNRANVYKTFENIMKVLYFNSYNAYLKLEQNEK